MFLPFLVCSPAPLACLSERFLMWIHMYERHTFLPSLAACRNTGFSLCITKPCAQTRCFLASPRVLFYFSCRLVLLMPGCTKKNTRNEKQRREKIHEEMLEIDYDRSGTIEFQEFVILMRKVGGERKDEAIPSCEPKGSSPTSPSIPFDADE